MDLCAVCDSNKRFIYFLSRWPNSQHDQRIFAAGDLCRNPAFYFSPGQYLLGDSAYTNSMYLVTPYKAPHTRDPCHEIRSRARAKARWVDGQAY